MIEGTIESLLAKAEELAGRAIEVEQTMDGMFVVLFMRFDRSPPRKGKTEEEALRFFIEDLEKFKQTEQGQLEARFEQEDQRRGDVDAD